MSTPDIPERYSRQVRFPGIGPDGQRKLLDSKVTLVGCGALGTVLANALVRAGVGYLRLIDRDFIETNNLQRQILFDEADVASNLPKAEAAARKLRVINSGVTVEPVVTDVDRRVDCCQLARRGLGFGQVGGDVVLVEEDLTLQVVRLDEIAVDEPQMADAAAYQRVG